jgi:hypothetical protein
LTLPSGKFFSPRDRGADDSKDSDPDPITGQTGVITAAAGQSYSHRDAGMYENAIIINEIYPNPAGSDNQAGTASWERVELKNTGSVDCNIGGWTIRDDEASPILYTIPVNTIISAGGYLVVHAGGSTGGISNSDGDPVKLHNSAGIEVDNVGCPASSNYEGLSYSCLPDASDNWNFWGEPTLGGILSSESLPGAPNMGQDQGDAPDSFKTKRSSNGARHFLTGPHLGAQVDYERDGQPGANADGDGSDDDGAAFPGDIIAGMQSELRVTASAPGALSAWMDFNGDGDFDDPAERIAADRALLAGEQTITFDVPSGTEPGFSYARLRLSN